MMGAREPVQFNPFLPEVIDDPYPLYCRLRTEDPVHQSAMGTWVLIHYDDVALFLRDPRFGRRDNRHLAFGWGIHFCLGAPLACLEGQLDFRTLLRRLPNQALAAERVEWRQTATLRGLGALPVRF
jgi:cytochrome P450